MPDTERGSRRRSDHNRFASSEIHAGERAGTVADFSQRAVASFADHGIVGIERPRTDNATGLPPIRRL